MSRSFYTPAVVLNVRQFGEDNREAVMLSPDKGIINAVVYGGGKSKLKSLVSPFHSGTVWLYHDPVRNSTKVTDFDVQSFQSEIRENLTRTLAASLVAELVMLTAAGGTEPAEIFTIVTGFLEGICKTDDDGTKYGLLRFLWRYIDKMGMHPDIYACSRCDTPIEFSREKNKNAVLWYTRIDDTFVCPHCMHDSEPGWAVSAEMADFLDSIDRKPMHISRNMRISAGGYQLLRHIIFTMITKMCGAPLRSLTTSEGII